MWVTYIEVNSAQYSNKIKLKTAKPEGEKNFRCWRYLLIVTTFLLLFRKLGNLLMLNSISDEHSSGLDSICLNCQALEWFFFSILYCKRVTVIVDNSLQKSFRVLCSESKPRPVPVLIKWKLACGVREFRGFVARAPGSTNRHATQAKWKLKRNFNQGFISRHSCYVDAPCKSLWTEYVHLAWSINS